MEIVSYKQAIDFIFAQIPSRKDLFSGDIGLTRTKYLLDNLGNPQNDFKSIHIAGTSGKGSTATIIANLLHANGYRVGLTLSPHLIDIRERIQINNNLIKKSSLLSILNDIMPAIKATAKSRYGHPTYFEIIMAIYFVACKQNKVDYAVIETGLGGRIDGTNVIDRNDKISVITKVGKDHTHILGKYLYQIAKEKGGIINQNSHCFLIDQSKTVIHTIADICKKNESTIHVVHPNNITALKIGNEVMTFTLKNTVLDIKIVETTLIGVHQSENILLALNILEFITQRDSLDMKKDTITETLRELTFPGRLETLIYQNKKLFIDGAHNPQKMESLVKSLKLITDKKFDVILSIKAGKDYKKLVDTLLEITNSFILTTFKINQENTGECVDPILIKEYIINKTTIQVTILSNPINAVNKLVKSKRPKLITGSLYLISKIKSII